MTSYNIKVRRGNTKQVPLRFRTRSPSGALSPVNLTGAALVFRAVWDGGALRLESGIDDYVAGDSDTPLTPGWAIPLPASGDATLYLSHVNTRALPVGQVRYAVERRIGGEQTDVLWGYLQVEEWANDD